LICIESIYSTDGSVAPIREICRLAQRYGAQLIVDEAHAVGVIGPNGRGLVAKYNLSNQVFAQIVTFGKALGTHGAIVLGDENLKAMLVNYANPFIYTTALPALSLAAIKCAYALFPQMEKERLQIERLRQSCGASSQIYSLRIKGNAEAKQAARRLADRGFDVRALLSPTVQRGEERLRICLHAFNTEKELKQLCKELS
jgi:8-amino-7-oxononanoate synthase